MAKTARKRSPIVGLPGSPFPVRADASMPTNAEIAATIADFRRTFEAFRAKNDERLAEVARGRDDVVTRETTDAINARVGELDATLRAFNERMALANLTAQPGTVAATPEARAHAQAFSQYVRRGVDAGLGELEVRAALQTDINRDGGYTVPEEMDRQITRVAQTRNGFRSVAGQQTIGSQAYTKLHNVGGANAGWVTERGSRPETNTPRLVQISIPTNEMYAMPAATQTSLDDSFVNIDAWLSAEVGIAMSDLEGAAFISGDGVGKPRGFLSYTAATSTAASPSAWERVGYTFTGQSAGFAASNPGDKLLDLVYSLKVDYRSNARWLTNDVVIAELRKLKDGQGNYLLEPRINATGANFSLLGFDVVPDDNMPVIAANSFSLGFGDWSRFYKIVDRMGTRVLRDPYSSKPYVLFYTTKRVGGGVDDFHAAKFLKFGTS